MGFTETQGLAGVWVEKRDLHVQTLVHSVAPKGQKRRSKGSKGGLGIGVPQASLGPRGLGAFGCSVGRGLGRSACAGHQGR